MLLYYTSNNVLNVVYILYSLFIDEGHIHTPVHVDIYPHMFIFSDSILNDSVDVPASKSVPQAPAVIEVCTCIQ